MANRPIQIAYRGANLSLPVEDPEGGGESGAALWNSALNSETDFELNSDNSIEVLTNGAATLYLEPTLSESGKYIECALPQLSGNLFIIKVSDSSGVIQWKSTGQFLQGPFQYTTPNSTYAGGETIRFVYSDFEGVKSVDFYKNGEFVQSLFVNTGVSIRFDLTALLGKTFSNPTTNL